MAGVILITNGEPTPAVRSSCVLISSVKKIAEVKQGELLGSLRSKGYGNQQPSLSWEAFEGSTTRTHDLEQIMKSIHSSEWKCPA
jgi:hypothetical protein